MLTNNNPHQGPGLHYTLTRTGRGYIDGRQSVFCDLTERTELSFFMPEGTEAEGCDAVLTVVTDRGKRYQERLTQDEGNPLAWRYLLMRGLLQPQLLQFTVSLCRGGNVLRSWVCEPLRISSLNGQLSAQRAIDPAIVEQAAEEIRALNGLLAAQDARIEVQDKRIAQLEADRDSGREEIAGLKRNNAAIAETLEAIVRQVDLIENKYNIIDTIKEEN